MIRVVPANEAPFEDLLQVFGKDATGCFCQRFKLGHSKWNPEPAEYREAQLLEQTGCGDPAATTTSGLVAYLDDEPVGWCAVEPRTAYTRLFSGRSPVPWKGRTEDKDDDSVWAITCFVTRLGYRKQGITAVLAEAAVDFARSRGARALECYAMRHYPGKEITWGELHVGPLSSLVDAGFVEVSTPTLRRVVMRIDF